MVQHRLYATRTHAIAKAAKARRAKAARARAARAMIAAILATNRTRNISAMLSNLSIHIAPMNINGGLKRRHSGSGSPPAKRRRLHY
jgi:hypothetical protein